MEFAPNPQELLSFPTRRSSDLAADHATSFTDWLSVVRLTRRDRTKVVPSRRAPPCVPLGGYGTGFETVPSGDRKSTRLNSSHLVISYAVFCLKKKKPRKKRKNC